MGVKGPVSPLSSGAEPLEPLSGKELQKIVKSGKFEETLNKLEQSNQTDQTQQSQSPTRSGLQSIALKSDLSNQQGAMEAVKQSAGFMIGSRLNEKLKKTKQGEEIVEELSEFVTNDPALNKKILGLLQKMKREKN